MNAPRDQVPELWLEQLLLGELSADEERRLRATLAPQEIERRLNVLRAANAAYAERAVGAEHGARIAERARVEKARLDLTKKRDRSARYLWPSLAVLGCLGLLLWRGPDLARAPAGSHGGADIRVKGLRARVVVYRRRGNDVETLASGAVAHRSDVLQLGYVAADARYGAIVSIDGAGAVTLHFPSQETGSTELTPHGEHLLDHAYELDAAPAFERFFFVTSTQPVDVARVLTAARVLARSNAKARRELLGLPSALQQDALMLVKE